MGKALTLTIVANMTSNYSEWVRKYFQRTENI